MVGKRDGDPNGIRTRVAGVKGQCPRPLDDGVARSSCGLYAALSKIKSFQGTI